MRRTDLQTPIPQPTRSRPWGLLFWLTMTWCLPATGQETALQTLVDAVIQAHGGAEAIERVAAVRAEGEIHAFLRGGRGSYTRWLERPRRLRVETVYPRESETRILDGRQVWRGSGGQPPRPVAGQGHLAVVYQYKQLDLPFGLLKGAYRLRHFGRETLDGVDTEVLELTDEEGPPLRVNVDAASHLIARVAGTFTHGGMSMSLGIDFADYRPVAGVPLPHRMRNYAGGRAVSETVITRYELNPPTDPARFRPAAEPLHTARAGQ